MIDTNVPFPKKQPDGMLRVLINTAAKNALIACGASGNLESAGGDLWWVDLDRDVWEELERRMAGEWEACETAEDEAACVSRAILRATSGQTGNA